MKKHKKQENRINAYLLKNFERDAQVILSGLGCLFVFQIFTVTLPQYYRYYFHVPVFPPFLPPGLYGPTSIYVWIGYLISGIIIGRIAKHAPVLFAFGTGLIFASLYVFFIEHLLPPGEYLYTTFAVQAFIFPILFTSIGGLIGTILKKN